MKSCEGLRLRVKIPAYPAYIARLTAAVFPIAIASLKGARMPTRTPLVTVVIATYNWSSVLRCAIESVRRQTYPNWELVVVGDGCTDDSGAVVQSFGDSRIRWTNLPRNSGSQSVPNNAGLELARGGYVAYLGHDDLWLPDHLTRLVDALERTGAGLASTVCESIGPPGSHVFHLAPLTDKHRFRDGVPPSALMHRRDVVEEVGGWRDYRDLVEPPDLEFISRVAGGKRGITHVPALTVCKFNSAWRKNSYVDRRSDEQMHYATRIANERLFVLRELARFLLFRVMRVQEVLPSIPEPPPEIPRGWYVTQWRRVRGLEEEVG